LKHFLAVLATDQEKLAGYLRNPDEVMQEAGLSEADRAVLRSGDRSALEARLGLRDSSYPSPSQGIKSATDRPRPPGSGSDHGTRPRPPAWMRFIRRSGAGRSQEEAQDEPRAESSTRFACFLRGIGSVLELIPPSPTLLRQTTADPLREDWRKIGGDLHRAIDRVRAEPGRD
jgi:hypothetical protein